MQHKKIDQLFKEKLQGFERMPSEGVWKNIENKLDNKKKKRTLPFWYWLGGAAAAIALFLILNQSNVSNTPVKEQVITNKKVEKPKNILKEENTLLKEKSTKQNTVLVTPNKEQIASSKKKINHTKKTVKAKKIVLGTNKEAVFENTNKNNVATNKISSEAVNYKEVSKKETFKQKESLIAKTKTTEKESIENTNKKEPKLKDLQEIVANNAENKENAIINQEQKETKKWTIATIVAPVFYTPFETTGSSVDSQFSNNPKTTDTNLSYGVAVNYAFNDKLSLQSGINKLSLSYSNADVYVLPSINAEGLSSVSANTSNIAVSSRDFSSLEEGFSTKQSTQGTLNQEYGYIEIPLEVKYKLNNSKKWGVNVVGGFSTLILDTNQISVTTPEITENIGEATNLNDLNFSGNLGLDVDIKITKNLFFNVAPKIKIQTNTFSKDEGNLNPYFLGIYSGLNFKF